MVAPGPAGAGPAVTGPPETGAYAGTGPASISARANIASSSR
jgi:hypothetical protein